MGVQLVNFITKTMAHIVEKCHRHMISNPISHRPNLRCTWQSLGRVGKVSLCTDSLNLTAMLPWDGVHTRCGLEDHRCWGNKAHSYTHEGNWLTLKSRPRLDTGWLAANIWLWLWNTLSTSIHDIDSVTSFKSGLKTHLFTEYFLYELVIAIIATIYIVRTCFYHQSRALLYFPLFSWVLASTVRRNM